MHRWTDPRTLNQGKTLADITGHETPAANNADLAWIRTRTTVKQQ
jgi:hypothetical protein